MRARFDKPPLTDTRTLAGARYILTVKNERKYEKQGALAPGVQVFVLRRNDHGYYLPCYARIHHITPQTRVCVDLWIDKSERVTVSATAVLWPPIDDPLIK